MNSTASFTKIRFVDIQWTCNTFTSTVVLERTISDSIFIVYFYCPQKNPLVKHHHPTIEIERLCC